MESFVYNIKNKNNNSLRVKQKTLTLMTTKDAVLDLLKKKIKTMERKIESRKFASDHATTDPSTRKSWKKICRKKNLPIPSDEEMDAEFTEMGNANQEQVDRYATRKNALVAISRIIENHVDDDYLEDVELSDLDLICPESLDPINPDDLEAEIEELNF